MLKMDHYFEILKCQKLNRYIETDEVVNLVRLHGYMSFPTNGQFSVLATFERRTHFYSQFSKYK